jgi:hypothetical protein
MKGAFELFDRRTKAYVPAQLVSPLDSDHADDFKRLWKPEFDRHLQATHCAADLEAAQLQDSHWLWPEKIAANATQLSYESFAVVVDGCTQGMMFLNLVRHCRLPEQRGKPLAYVHLLATAPWNRPALAPEPHYKGVGTLLLGAAISFSIEQEFGGRVGLHALPQSASWYRDICCMTDCGPDSDILNMHYFEMTEAQARAFIDAP